MNYVDFLKFIMKTLNDELFQELKDSLLEEYITFSFVDKRNITKEVMFEKLCDYFEKIELKTGKKFDKIIEKYAENVDSLVSGHIVKVPKAKKNEPLPEVPRSRKYYDKATTARKSSNESKQVLVDYSRIMLCLYMAIIRKDFETINDFDYSVTSLNLTKIIDSMRAKKEGITKKPKFDTKDIYGNDRCTFILVIMMYYYIKSKEVVGEY